MRRFLNRARGVIGIEQAIVLVVCVVVLVWVLRALGIIS